MKVKEFLKEFYEKPFASTDNLDLTFKGNNLNIFQKYKRLQKSALALAILGLVAWIVCGFDSCIGQPLMLLNNLPEFLLGNISYEQWISVYFEYYGKEMHYSAFVIYGLMYWALSRHFDKNLGIVKSKNVAYSASLTFLSIAIFEFYWIHSYAYFQNQWWVATWRLPQLRILLQNVAFITVGALGVLYIWADSCILNDRKEIVKRLYKFRFNKKALMLIGVSIFAALLWIYYPFYVERFSVELETGDLWTNSNHFPQTLYTIDMDPTDSVNAGVWFFHENNPVHLLNTIVKVLWTYTVFYIGKVRRVET